MDNVYVPNTMDTIDNVCVPNPMDIMDNECELIQCIQCIGATPCSQYSRLSLSVWICNNQLAQKIVKLLFIESFHEDLNELFLGRSIAGNQDAKNSFL